MCLIKRIFERKEKRPAGNLIGKTVFPENAAGREPSENEKRLYELFEKDPVKLTAEERKLRAETEEAFLKAKQALGKCPINITSGTALPLALAKFLLIRGFDVWLVTTEDLYPGEKADYGWLAVHFPNLRLAKGKDPGNAALYLDEREPIMFDPERESLEMLALRMAETAWGMRFFV